SSDSTRATCACRWATSTWWSIAARCTPPRCCGRSTAEAKRGTRARLLTFAWRSAPSRESQESSSRPRPRDEGADPAPQVVQDAVGAEVLHLGERVAVGPALLLHPVERDHRAGAVDAVQAVHVDRVRLGVAHDGQEAASLRLGRRVGRLEREALVAHARGAHALALGLAMVVAKVDHRADPALAQPLDALLVGLAAAVEAGRDLRGVVDAPRALDRPREAAP